MIKLIYEVFVGTYDGGKMSEDSFVGTISDEYIDSFTTYLVKGCGFMECLQNCLYLRHQVEHTVDVNHIANMMDYDLDEIEENLDEIEGICCGETELVRITKAENAGSIRVGNFDQIMKPLNDKYHSVGIGLWFAEFYRD